MTTLTHGVSRSADAAYDELLRLDRPCFVVRDEDGIGVTTEPDVARRRGQILAAVPALLPHALGSAEFRRAYAVEHAYMAGAMANGIASPQLVAALANAGFLASYGAAGMVTAKVDAALAEVRLRAPGRTVACNLIHSPSEPAMERDVVALCLRHGVRVVEASAFLDLTPQVVHYRLAGLRQGPDGSVIRGNRVIAKLSRAEVAERFLRPAPDALVRPLVEAGLVTPEQAALARRVPVADDVTTEADSGGHTDRRPLVVLLPEIVALREKIQRELRYDEVPRVGAAGGIGTPSAVAAAYALGVAYVVTGSVNQATVEAAQSPAAKALLAAAGVTDTEMAPSSDMFEMGVQVQVLRRGTMFAGRAGQLYDLYRRYDSLDDLPAADRATLEKRVFRLGVDEVWTECVKYFQARDPEQITRALDDPKRRMALVFRWYLGLSSFWSIAGERGREVDYQVWCGPAMGAFNAWAAGTYLAELPNRRVADVATQLMRGATFASRIAELRLAGVRLPSACSTYVPRENR